MTRSPEIPDQSRGVGLIRSALLLARALARPIAIHIATGAPSAFQDAVLHTDQRRVALRTGDNRLLELDLETGALTQLDRDIMEPTPIAPYGTGWTYLKRDRDGVTIRRGGAVLRWRGPLPLTALLSDGVSDYAVADGGLYRLAPDTLVLVRADVIAATSLSTGAIFACTTRGELVRVQAGRTEVSGACQHFDNSNDFAAAGDAIVVQGTGRRVRRITPAGETTLDRLADSLAISSDAVVAGVSHGGETWYTAPDTARSVRGPASSAAPSAVAVGGHLAAWGFRDGSAAVVDTRTGRQWRLNARPESTSWIFVTRSERRAVTVSASEVRVWSLEGERPSQLAQIPCYPSHLASSPDHSLLGFECSAGGAGAVVAATGEILELHRHGARAFGIVWWGRALCTGGWDGQVLCTDPADRKTRTLIRQPSPIRWIDADGERIAFSAEDGSVWLGDDRLGPDPLAIASHAASATRLALGRDGLVASASVDGQVTFSRLLADRTAESRSMQLADRAAYIHAIDGEMLVVDRAGSVLRTVDGRDVIKHRAPVGKTLSRLEPFAPDAWVAVVDGRSLWIHAAHDDTTVAFDATIKVMARSPSHPLVAFAAGADVFVVDVARGTIGAIEFGDMMIVALAFESDETLYIVVGDRVLFRAPLDNLPVVQLVHNGVGK